MRPARSFLYGSVCIAGSVAGAFLGYWIGYALFENVGQHIVGMLGMGSQFSSVLVMYHDNAWFALLLAGFTAIPFSLFTIAAGFRQTLDPVTLGLASLTGRAVRFYLIGALLYFFGPTMKRYLDRYLPAVSLLMLGLFVLVVIVLRGIF
jgi:membrane protein YqaA with SNARE-associated domain